MGARYRDYTNLRASKGSRWHHQTEHRTVASAPIRPLPYAGRNNALSPHVDVNDPEFHALQQAYHSHGRLITTESVVTSLRDSVSQPVSLVAHWISSKKVPAIFAKGAWWVPAHSIDLEGQNIQPGVEEVMMLLSDLLDSQEVMWWFIEPNMRLEANQCPMDILKDDPVAAMEAALAERVTAIGNKQSCPG